MIHTKTELPTRRTAIVCSSTNHTVLDALLAACNEYNANAPVEIVEVSSTIEELPIVSAGKVLSRLKADIVGIEPVPRPCLGISVNATPDSDPSIILLKVAAWGDNIVAKSITERTSTSELSSAVTKLLNDVIELSSDPAKRVSSIQEVTRLDEYIDKLLHAGGVPLLWVRPDGQVATSVPEDDRKLVLPGFFYPLHQGHIQLLDASRTYLEQYGQKFDFVGFELSAVNADKGRLTRDEVLNRIAQFAGKWNIVVTTAPTYIMKAHLLEGNTTFVVGHDTAVRLIMKKYYNDNEMFMNASFQELANLGCSFLVAGRVLTTTTDGQTTFATLDSIAFPPTFRHKSLFKSLPAEVFRNDISSTEIRRRYANYQQ